MAALYLDWFQKEFEVLTMLMGAVGLPCNVIFQSNVLDSEIVSAEKILVALGNTIPKICDVFEVAQTIADTQKELEKNRNILQMEKRMHSAVCKALLLAAEGYYCLDSSEWKPPIERWPMRSKSCSPHNQ